MFLLWLVRLALQSPGSGAIGECSVMVWYGMYICTFLCICTVKVFLFDRRNAIFITRFLVEVKIYMQCLETFWRDECPKIDVTFGAMDNSLSTETLRGQACLKTNMKVTLQK